MHLTLTRWFQMKKLSTTKFYNFSRSTTFMLIVFEKSNFVKLEMLWLFKKVEMVGLINKNVNQLYNHVIH
jgi:hypothetical protein